MYYGHSMQFISLPVELICRIFDFLDCVDLVRCTAVAKGLRVLMLASSKLQYIIELEKHRMMSLLSHSDILPYVTRLKLLRDREYAWRTLRWKARYNVDVPPTGSVYEFAGGLYASGKEDAHNVTSSISFVELPSGDLGGDPNMVSWTHSISDIIIIDITMDPAEDLLVLVALAQPSSEYVYEVHLRTLSTNAPHPKASLPKLTCVLKPTHQHQVSEHVPAVRIQVLDNLVALLFKEVHENIGAHLEIWDWVNGPGASFKMSRITGIDDFTFLAKDTFLLVRPSGSFEVYTFDLNIKAGAQPPIHRATYDFPKLSDGYLYWYITISSNPSPGVVPRSRARRGHQPTYHPQLNERIQACCLYVLDPSTDDAEQRISCFVFFVNLYMLLHPPDGWLQKVKSKCIQQKVKAGRRNLDPGYSPPSMLTPYIDNALSPVPPYAMSPSQPCPSSYYVVPTSPSSPRPSSSPPFTVTSFTASTTSSLPSVPFPSQQPPPTTPKLFRCQPALRPSTHPPKVPVHFPWSVWGPQSTRWFQECLNTDWQHSIYGLRTIDSVAPEDLRASPAAWLHPFPPLANPGTNLDKKLKEGTTFIPLDDPSSESISTGNTIHSTSMRSVAAQIDSDASRTDQAIPGEISHPQSRGRHLRLRDYNPNTIIEQLREDDEKAREGVSKESKGKGREKANPTWKRRRVVMEPSTIHTKGVFKHDVTSWLPYVEVVSEDTFEVTDVMMDHSRLLLLRVRK